MKATITILPETEFAQKCTLIELSQIPTPEEMDELFIDESVVLCF